MCQSINAHKKRAKKIFKGKPSLYKTYLIDKYVYLILKFVYLNV